MLHLLHVKVNHRQSVIEWAQTSNLVELLLVKATYHVLCEVVKELAVADGEDCLALILVVLGHVSEFVHYGLDTGLGLCSCFDVVKMEPAIFSEDLSLFFVDLQFREEV